MSADPTWRSPPRGRLTLSDDAVHVWRASLAMDAPVVATFAETLSAEERERASRFRTPELAGRFIAGRGIVRAVLARYLNARPGELNFSWGDRGKPALMAPHRWLRFNASNSGGVILVAVTAGRRVGVDLEQLRPVPEALAIADRMLSPREKQALREVPEDLRERAFLDCWTRKEAFIKAIGAGLWTGLDTFDVAFAPGEEACLLALHGSADEAGRWTLRALDPGPGYAAALVTEGRIGEVSTFAWA